VEALVCAKDWLRYGSEAFTEVSNALAEVKGLGS
jgi:hypothetical protein